MRSLLAIAGRETGSFFHSAMAPVALGGFLVLVGLFYTMFLFGFSEQSLQAAEATLPQGDLTLAERVFQPLVTNAAVFLLFLLPAVSMRLLSGEYRSGRYDLLASYPVGEGTWIVGKWLSAMAAAAVLILAAGAYVAATAFLGEPEAGPPLAAGLGLLMLSAALAAWGVFFSALVQYQLVSYFLSFAFLFSMFILGGLEPFLPPAAAPLIAHAAWAEHLDRFSRGVLDSRDVVFFAGWTALGLLAAAAVLTGRRLGGLRRLGPWLPTAVMAVLFVLAQVIAARHPLAADLTSNRRHSPAPQTEQVLAMLEDDVRVLAFYERLDPSRRPLESLLQSLRDRNPRFSWRVVDPVREAGLVQQYEVTAPRTVVVEREGRRSTLLDPREGALANAIYRLAAGTRPVVYHLLGHGEHRVDSEDRGGYSRYAQELADEGYLVRNLLLAEMPAVPADADLVIVSAPKVPPTAAELEALRVFIAGGGSLLLLLDPGTPEPFDAWLRDFNLALGNDFLVSADQERRQFGVDPRVVVVSETYADHPATEALAGVATLFPLTQSIGRPYDGVVGVTQQWLLRTDDRTWAERDLSTIASGRPEFERGRDLPGPVVFGWALTVDRASFFGAAGGADGGPGGAAGAGADSAAAAAAAPDGSPGAASGLRRPQTNRVPDDPVLRRLHDLEQGSQERGPGLFRAPSASRIVVLGDSDFAANANLGLYGNRDLLLNLVGWLARESSLVSFQPRAVRDEGLVLSVGQKEALGWLAIGGWPLAVAGLAAVAVVRHRRRH